jgi:hypothetical protein
LFLFSDSIISRHILSWTQTRMSRMSHLPPSNPASRATSGISRLAMMQVKRCRWIRHICKVFAILVLKSWDFYILLELISSTFYTCIFHAKFWCQKSHSFVLGLNFFGAIILAKKSTCKMLLVKITCNLKGWCQLL